MEKNKTEKQSSTTTIARKKRRNKRKAEKCVSLEERTPKRLKCLEPDVTVVVGGVEFYHYKTILCNSCEFFDTMLSANMKESIHNRIEFPDKKPHEWMEVYKLLDPAEWNDEKPRSSLITKENALTLLPWFDFLGLENLTRICDKVAAKYYPPARLSSYKTWLKWKHLPCPAYQERMFIGVKLGLADFFEVTWSDKDKALKTIKSFLLDEQCGDELWNYLLSQYDFPSTILEQIDRQSIVMTPLLPYLLRKYKK